MPSWGVGFYSFGVPPSVNKFKIININRRLKSEAFQAIVSETCEPSRLIANHILPPLQCARNPAEPVNRLQTEMLF